MEQILQCEQTGRAWSVGPNLSTSWEILRARTIREFVCNVTIPSGFLFNSGTSRMGVTAGLVFRRKHRPLRNARYSTSTALNITIEYED